MVEQLGTAPFSSEKARVEEEEFQVVASESTSTYFIIFKLLLVPSSYWTKDKLVFPVIVKSPFIEYIFFEGDCSDVLCEKGTRIWASALE
jgi:hypothetical protein